MSLFKILKDIIFGNTEETNPVKNNSEGFTIQVNYPELPSREIPSLELNLKGIKKSKNGLYPHEILILDYASSYKINESPNQGFWLYRYGVEDTKIIVDKLYSSGFLIEASIKESLSKETVNTLKHILKKYNLKMTGRKNELLERISSEIPENDLKEYVPIRSYALTDLGKEELASNEYVMYIHKKSIDDLDIWSLNKLINKEPKMNYRDKLWGYLNTKGLKYFSKKEFGMYRNIRLQMVNFLIEEEKYVGAIPFLGEVIAIDLNECAMDSFAMDYYIENNLKMIFPYEESIYKLTPYTISLGNEIIQKSNISNEEAKKIMLEYLDKVNLELNIFSKKECIDIFLFEKDGDTDQAKNIYENTIKKNINKASKNLLK